SGKGRDFIDKIKLSSESFFSFQNILLFGIFILAILSPWWIRQKYGDIMGAASLIGSMFIVAIFAIFLALNKKTKLMKQNLPKILVDNSTQKKPPFIDATGSKEGALLGDVLHDPLQSGGFGTPAYQRIVPGAIHKAHKGVLFVDEIGLLNNESQQGLLTAMQEKKLTITGRSERSSGAMVQTEPVPCDFILVAAGNLETLRIINPALRNRIRGYGYEVYMNTEMEDNEENRYKIAQFVAQEVEKDKKIPHFSKDAVDLIIREAQLMAGTSGKLTLKLRELGGLVRAAGDLASEEKSKLVEPKHILNAKKLARSLEKQIAEQYIEKKKEYQIIITKGEKVGRVNGLAVIGSKDSYSGIVLPIEATITPGGKKTEFIATGKLGEIAKEAIQNVSALIMKYFGLNIIEKKNIYVQFLQTYEGVEGDSASIAVATAIISSLMKVPIKQNIAMTGSLSVHGEVLAVGGVNQKIEAALEAGINEIIIPQANFKDLNLSKENLKNVKIIEAKTIQDVLKYALSWQGKTNLKRKLNIK
ncbi:ATP-dependent protease LonB, partial [Candidatus Pacearchaeota archaeon CG_4_9_14_3_um_filter_31_7]